MWQRLCKYVRDWFEWLCPPEVRPFCPKEVIHEDEKTRILCIRKSAVIEKDKKIR